MTTINLPETIAFTPLPQRPQGHSDMDTGHARNGKKLSGLAIKTSPEATASCFANCFSCTHGHKTVFLDINNSA